MKGEEEEEKEEIHGAHTAKAYEDSSVMTIRAQQCILSPLSPSLRGSSSAHHLQEQIHEIGLIYPVCLFMHCSTLSAMS